jgi:hypothetical protein
MKERFQSVLQHAQVIVTCRLQSLCILNQRIVLFSKRLDEELLKANLRNAQVENPDPPRLSYGCAIVTPSLLLSA